MEGRYVTVVEHAAQLYCIDSTCYHAGGPLGVGDIEEVTEVLDLRLLSVTPHAFALG